MVNSTDYSFFGATLAQAPQMHIERIARKSDLEPGQWFTADVAGASIAVCAMAGHYCAVRDVCPHEHWQLSDSYIVNDAIVCSLHGATFDAHSGECLSGPACGPLQLYPVVEMGDDLYVEIASEALPIGL